MKSKATSIAAILALAAAFGLAQLFFTPSAAPPREPDPSPRRASPPLAKVKAPLSPTKATPAPAPKPSEKPGEEAPKRGRTLTAALSYACGRPISLTPGLALYRPGAAPLKGEAEGRHIRWRLPEEVRGRYALYTDFEIGRRSSKGGEKAFLKKKAGHPFVRFAGERPSIDLGAALPEPWPVTLELTVEAREVLVTVTRAGEPAPGARLRYTPQPYAPFFYAGARDLFLGAETDAAGQAALLLPASRSFDLSAQLGALRGRASVSWPPPARIELELAAPVRREDDPELCHVKFIISDPDGEPVKKARVEVELVEAFAEADPPTDLLQRGDARFFRTTELHFRGRLGRYRGRVETDDSLTSFELLIDRRGELIEERITLRALPELAGAVVGPEGAAVVGARVALTTFLPQSYGSVDWQSRRSDRRAETDSLGRFRLRSRKPRERWLLVFKEGYEVAAIDLRDRGEPLIVALRAGSELYGRLLDADGAPLVKARLRLGVAKKKLWGRTDGEGRFRFRGLPRAGALSLEVSATETSPEATFLSGLIRDRDQVLTLPRGEGFRVRLRWRGEPLTDRRARVALLALKPDQSRAPAGLRWPLRGSRSETHDGAIAFAGLAPGRYLLEASARIAEEELELSYAAAVRLPRGELIIDLQESASLELRGPEGAGPLRVELLPESASRLTDARREADNIWWYYGSCHRERIEAGKARRIRATPPGRYRLTWGPKGGPTRSRDIDLAPGEERVLHLGS